MPDNEKTIYEEGADQYERLIAHEDYQGNLLPAIQDVLSLENLRAVDLGTGTGRLIRLLAGRLKDVIGLDTSAAMLDVARRKMSQGEPVNWLFGQADHRRLPLASCSVDLIVSGWSICYLVVWHPETWRTELEQALGEMKRVLQPHGSILLLETLGTGCRSPRPPAILEPYFDWLDEKGFSHTWLRTDYYFPDRKDAFELTRFFFGKDMCASLLENPFGVTLPECTGLWWFHRRYSKNSDFLGENG